jgi:hypothetical protein
MVTDSTKNKLEDEVKELEDTKAKEEKRYK